MIVVIARTGRTEQRVAQDGVDHLPRGRFADAAGDGHGTASESIAIPSGQSRERGDRVVDLEAPATRRRLDIAAGHDGATGPAIQRVVGETAAILIRAGKSPKYVARFDLPAVDDDPANGCFFAGRRWQRGHPQASAHDLVQLIYG